MTLKTLGLTLCAVLFATFTASSATAEDCTTTEGRIVPCPEGLYQGPLVLPPEPKPERPPPATTGSATCGFYGMSAQTRQLAIQATLSYYGFDGGPSDDALDRKIRLAIADFQTYLGRPATGNLACTEVRILYLSRDWANANVDAIDGMAADNPDGRRGLIHFFLADTLEYFSSARESEGSPSFGERYATSRLAHECAAVAFVAGLANSSAATALMADPERKVIAQFCPAQSEVIRLSDARLSAVIGAVPAVIHGTQAEIYLRCWAFAKALAPVRSNLALLSPAEAERRVQGLLTDLGIERSRLLDYGEMCVGMGYHRLSLPVSLTGALMLAGSGLTGYREIVGHHVALGLGTVADSERAIDWYNATIASTRDSEARDVLNVQHDRRMALADLVDAITQR